MSDMHAQNKTRPMTDTNATEFQPSESQLEVLKAFQAKGYDCSVEDGCSNTSTHRVTWYKWHDDCPGFSDWWAAKAITYFARKLPAIYAALTKGAKVRLTGGDPTAAKLLLERFDKGFVPRSAKDINAHLTGSIDSVLKAEQEEHDGEKGD